MGPEASQTSEISYSKIRNLLLQLPEFDQHSVRALRVDEAHQGSVSTGSRGVFDELKAEVRQSSSLGGDVSDLVTEMVQTLSAFLEEFRN